MDKTKTAVTQAIEDLERLIEISEKDKRRHALSEKAFDNICLIIAVREETIKNLQSLLPTEREQIINAYKAGFAAGDYRMAEFNPDNYFTTNYTQKG